MSRSQVFTRSLVIAYDQYYARQVMLITSKMTIPVGGTSETRSRALMTLLLNNPNNYMIYQGGEIWGEEMKVFTGYTIDGNELEVK